MTKLILFYQESRIIHVSGTENHAHLRNPKVRQHIPIPTHSTRIDDATHTRLRNRDFLGAESNAPAKMPPLGGN